MQTFGTQNFNDPKVEMQRQAELVKLGRVVETKRNELAGAMLLLLLPPPVSPPLLTRIHFLQILLRAAMKLSTGALRSSCRHLPESPKSISLFSIFR
jgi:hypothetical protein